MKAKAMKLELNRILIIILIIFPQILSAGPPFLTDDPDPVQYKHWEYYISSQNTFNHSTHISNGTLPHSYYSQNLYSLFEQQR